MEPTKWDHMTFTARDPVDMCKKVADEEETGQGKEVGES